MAEEMEKAQRALRDMDYDSMSEDGNDEEHGSFSIKRSSVGTPSRSVDDAHPAAALPSPEVSSASATKLELFLSSGDTDGNIFSEGPTKNSSINNPYDSVLIDTSQPSTLPTKHSTIGSHGMVTTTNTIASGPLVTLPSPSDLLKEPPAQNSLMDDDDSAAAFSVELQSFKTDTDPNDIDIFSSGSPNASSKNKIGAARPSAYPGTAGFLEMEEEPPREVFRDKERTETNNINDHIHNDATFGGESIKTDSGLVLTHRKTTNAASPHRKRQHHPPLHQNVFRETQKEFFEVENGVFQERNKGNPNFPHRKEGGNYFAGSSAGMLGGGNGKHSMVMVQAKRLMSFVRIWVVLFLVVVLAMTGVFFHSMGRQEDQKIVVAKEASISINSAMNANANANSIAQSQDTAPDTILLLPLTDSARLASSLQQQQHQKLDQNYPRRLQTGQEVAQVNMLDSSAYSSVASNGSDNSVSSHHFLMDLRQEFEDWIQHHGKAYQSVEEKELRFSIWSQNHQRTAEKNSRHGPCTLTKQHVFGSNQFKDLAPEEFQSKFLTGYKGAFTDVLEKKQQELSPGMRRLRKNSGIGMVLDPKIHKVKVHESVVEKQRHLKENYNYSSRYRPQVVGSSSINCQWYDISCVLRYVWQSTGIQFGSFIGTMEPKYDAEAFPNSVDWRDSGAVTDVRTQGECGACWAITAVENVESAYFIATGNLYSLSESEIIICDDSCEMCSGGWPQNAFEWVMDHGGLLLRSNLPYDAYTLIALTAGLEGESDYYDEETVESYREQVCPADGDSGSGSGSNDNYWEDGVENGNYGDYSSQGRYGNIKGYGYATDRCLCYTDGSGCQCDDQDEDTAVANIATYGPAVVCLEASTWQDYYGGVMTSEIGCGQEFLDMNHCVQVVGYAFTDGDDGSEDDQSGSASGSNSGSGDSNGREGYWIVRNQWGESWGMNGYAYVSMGENTCGILNDMTIAYS
jgi:C1A family cysteine protease